VMRPVSQSHCLWDETGSTPVRGAAVERRVAPRPHVQIPVCMDPFPFPFPFPSFLLERQRGVVIPLSMG
jgi:hypothetical protein